jgi:hypothetical protein
MKVRYALVHRDPDRRTALYTCTACGATVADNDQSHLNRTLHATWHDWLHERTTPR